MKTISIITLLALFNCSYSREICYDSLGCFIDTKPFGFTLLRPIGKLPESPAKIDTTFKLYNKYEKSGKTMTVDKIPFTYLKATETKIIIHGLNNNELSEWVLDMKNALLDNDNVNVIVVDWTQGSTLPYEQAVANTQVVAAITVNLIKSLVSKKSASQKDFHLIGFSLGAHTAGLIGKVVKIARITGLDPAGPYYEWTPKEVRLHNEDADFVDVIHTNSMILFKEIGFGILAPIGDVDYYPNGGQLQPGCSKITIDFNSIGDLLQNFDNATDTLACSHSASYKYFIDSIKDKCLFTSFPCDNFKDILAGKCPKCDRVKGCNRMGYWASAGKETGSLYLDTQLLAPSKC